MNINFGRRDAPATGGKIPSTARTGAKKNPARRVLGSRLKSFAVLSEKRRKVVVTKKGFCLLLLRPPPSGVALGGKNGRRRKKTDGGGGGGHRYRRGEVGKSTISAIKFA